MAALRLVLALDDLARLMAGGLRGRAEAIALRVDPHDRRGLLMHLERLQVSSWLPRMDVEIHLAATVLPAAHRLAVHYRVRPAGVSSLLLAGGQRLGGGRRIADAIAAAVGLDDAVVERSDTGLRLDLGRALRHAPVRLRLLALELHPEASAVVARFAIGASRARGAGPAPGPPHASGMSRLELDAVALTRVLAAVGVRATSSADGLVLAGAGWEAVLERIEVGGRVRIGPVTARIGRIAVQDGGVVAEFALE